MQQVIDHYPGEPAANISQYIWLKTLLDNTTRADYQGPCDITNHSTLVFCGGTSKILTLSPKLTNLAASNAIYPEYLRVTPITE